MKSFVIILILLILPPDSYSQIKQRSADVSVYAGFGYKFVFLTNSDARNAYPFFELSNGSFLKELDGFIGVTYSERYTIEISPSYLYSNSLSSDGFYFRDAGGNFFYYPQNTRLYAVPLNLRLKFFPFAKTGNSTLEKLYLGIGGGGMYISEEMTNEIYYDDSRSVYLGARTYFNEFWTSNYEILLGTKSFSKIGVGLN